MTHAMLYYRVKPINDGRDDLCVPDEKAALARIGVQHKVHTRIIALALYAINATPR